MTLTALSGWRLLAVPLLIAALAASARAELPEIGLTINGHKVTAEVARTDATRT